MKKFILLLLTAGLLAGVFSGCPAVPGDAQNAAGESDALEDTFSKAEQIDIYGGEGTLLRTLTADEGMDDFFDALGVMDWEWVDEPEERTAVEAVFVFSQTPVETVFGGRPAPDERQEVIRLTLYENSSVAELRLMAFTVQVELTEEALAALRTEAAPDADS